VPEWSFNKERLWNPFIQELHDDARAQRDRVHLREYDPRLVEFLELEAKGGPSFTELFEADLRLKQLKETRSYSGPNPFLDTVEYPNSTARAEAQGLLHRENKILSEALRAEANQGPVNPFTRQNITAMMRLFRADLSLAYLLDAAAQSRLPDHWPSEGRRFSTR
jgi:hypothetical protein